jgi:hypothetical protein
MTFIESKKLNWLQTPSAWEEAQAWRERRRAMMDQFQGDADLVLSSFSDAFSNQITESSKIATQAALKRLQGATKAARAKQAALLAAASGTPIKADTAGAAGTTTAGSTTTAGTTVNKTA